MRIPPCGDRRGSGPSDGARAALVAGPPGGDQRRGGLVLARALRAPLAPAGAVSWRLHPPPAARTSHYGVILISRFTGPLPHCAHDQNAGNALGHTNKITVQSDQGLRESAIDKIPSLDSHVPISLGVLSHHAWFAPNATVQQSDSASA